MPITTTATAEGFTPNHPVEDFFTVTIVSMPFTAFWALLGATAVAGISQQKFPPEFSDEMFIGAGATALGASLAIGLVSVSWGKGKGKAAPKAPSTTVTTKEP